MITEPRALGAHLYFFRNGAAFTVPSAGTCSKTSKPGAADEGWIYFGTLEDVKIEQKSTDIEVFGASPGQLRRTKKLRTKRTLDIMFVCQDLSDISLEIIFGTAALTAGGTQFNPLEGAEVEGWLKGQIYDHRDAQWITVDMWVCLEPDGPVSLNAADGQLNKVSIKAYGLYSALNTGSKQAS